MKIATISVLMLALACGLAGCNQSSNPAPSTVAASSSQAAPAVAPASAPDSAPAPSGAGDKFAQKLQELAGPGAANCGRPALNTDQQPAADCAMKASKAKKAFYVAYDMPGLTTGVAGASSGKLFSVQSEPAARGAVGQVTSAECPAALRVAQSGRVTCTAPGNMPGNVPSKGGNPHAGMAMPPADKGSPHGSMAMPPAGTTNPHQGGAPIEGAKSH